MIRRRDQDPELPDGFSDTFRNRFWNKVSKSSDDKCWEWTAHKTKYGYGMISMGLKYRPIQANRAAWILHNGAIPEGKYVCHACDNPGCVNPKHLWLGDPSDNVHDMIAKGRDKIRNGLGGASGDKNSRRKHPEAYPNWEKTSVLSDEKVDRIRSLAAAGELNQTQVAKMFGVTQSHISRIVNHKVCVA